MTILCFGVNVNYEAHDWVGLQRETSMLSLARSLRMKQVRLEIVGGITESIFPKVERMLLGDSDYRKALEYVAARKQMDRYRSMIDFMFCELYPKWRKPCFHFYDGDGPSLKEMLTVEQIQEYERRMVKALGVAHKLFCEQRCKSWCWYQKEVADDLRVAA